jgi:plastocyanin
VLVLTLRRVALGALVALTATIALAGAARGDQSVTMQNSQFAPRDVTVRVGETVTWMNNDSLGHSVTADDGSFDSSPACGTIGGRCVQRGESFPHRFGQAGRFPYYCRIHGAKGGQGMTGTVTVTG